MSLPPVPCVTAASEDKNNRSRHEKRSLRWVAADAETLCCAHVRSVVEITRETTVLWGKNKGKTSIERIIYICSLEPDAARGDELLERIRRAGAVVRNDVARCTVPDTPQRGMAARHDAEKRGSVFIFQAGYSSGNASERYHEIDAQGRISGDFL